MRQGSRRKRVEMSALDEVYDIQFVDNTNTEAAEAKGEVIRIVKELEAELATLRERVAAQIQALKVAEWGRMTPSGDWACPVCKMLENHDHADNCELAAALRGEA